MSRSWSQLPLDEVVCLTGASPEAIGLALGPLPDDAPAVVTYRPVGVTSSRTMIKNVLNALDVVATGLFPAWLPGAELIDGPSAAGTAAVRALALRTAATASDFGPFLADLAERSLRSRRPPTAAAFTDEVRAVGLARVIASSFCRSRLAVLVHVPDGLTPGAEQSLVAAFEWLVYHGRTGVWLIGARLRTSDRVRMVGAPAAAIVLDVTDSEALDDPDPAELLLVGYPALAGRPHPASDVEQALEAALAARPWAAGRRWNQTHRFGTLANPVKVDLLWPVEKCVVEVDGPEHRGAAMYEEDRRRDVNLQLDGFAVLRFTNAQVRQDVESVLEKIERYIHMRRDGQRRNNFNG